MLIDFNKLWPKYNINPKGVLHIGSSTGQETEHYINLGVRDICYIEALPDVYKGLKEHVKKFPGKFTCINACISELDGAEVIFNKTNNEGQSSSMLEFGTHSKEHPSVKVIEKMRLKTSRVDTLLTGNYKISGLYDFLNIDLQGAELMALKSMGQLLDHFKWIKGGINESLEFDFKWLYLEVNQKELYKGCPLIGDIENYIDQFGFKIVETKWTNHGWGDCLAIKK